MAVRRHRGGPRPMAPRRTLRPSLSNKNRTRRVPARRELMPMRSLRSVSVARPWRVFCSVVPKPVRPGGTAIDIERAPGGDPFGTQTLLLERYRAAGDPQKGRQLVEKMVKETDQAHK